MGTARVQHLVSFAVFDKEMVAARVEIVCVYATSVLLRCWHREGSDTRHQIPDHIPCFEFGLDKAVVLALESGIPEEVGWALHGLLLAFPGAVCAGGALGRRALRRGGGEGKSLPSQIFTCAVGARRRASHL